MTSSMVASTAISKVLQMFVNQDLFVIKMLQVFIFDFFGMLECCSLHFNKKIAESFMKKSISGLQKPLKLLKFFIFSKMLTLEKFFVQFQSFNKKIAQSMFLPLKTPIKNINGRKQKK